MSKLTKESACLAVKAWLNEWCKGCRFDVITASLGYFVCDHENGADLSLLKEFGIDTPKEYYDEKHWVPGRATFSFFLTNGSFNKIIEHAKALINES